MNNDNNKGLLNYFFEGFHLLNKNIEIFIVSLLLFLVPTFISLIKDAPTSVGLLFSLLSIAIHLIFISYSLSTPLLLKHKQEGGIIDFAYLKNTLPTNLKRLFDAPTLGISFILGFLIMGALIYAYITIKPDLKSLSANLNNLNKEWNSSYVIFTSIIAILQSVFVFSSIFFSIYNQKLYTALKNSVAYSFRNIKFVGIVAVIYVASSLIFTIINLLPLNTILLNSLGFASSIYIGMIATASALLYYQKNSN